MTSVTNINSQQDLGRFFDFIYGDQIGYAYSPTKNPDPNNPIFEQYFFKWPQERAALINHVLQKTEDLEVYYGPALYKDSGSAKKENFLGTSVVWVEFDGNDPANATEVPYPTIKIQSSTSKHEHWYWKLDEFISDISLLERVTQKLAYYLSADLGSWDGTQVLRPPGTRHHESRKLTSTLRWDTRPHSIQSFNDIPELPIAVLSELDIKHIPEPLNVIADYLWDPEFTDLFKAKVYSKAQYDALSPEERNKPGVGKDRNAALAKLAHFAMEAMGRDGKKISNAEVLAILYNADERWGKFKKRSDRKRRLIAIINSVRAKHPVDPVQEDVKPRLQVYTYEEFINTEMKLEWVIPNFIHRKGFMVLSGPADIGKSQLSLRFAEKLAKGEEFLKWKPSRPMRTLTISMEMPHEELHYIVDKMKFKGHELLNENLLVMPLGYSIRLTNKTSQAELAAVVDEFRPDGIIFDSLGVGIGDDLSSDKIILDTFDFVNKVLRDHFGAFVYFIHHYRKPQIGNKKPRRLEDLFGSGYIGFGITTCMGLWKVGDSIEVDCLKLRMAKKFDSFKIKRTPGLDFSIIEGSEISQNGNPVFGAVDGLDNPDGFMGRM